MKNPNDIKKVGVVKRMRKASNFNATLYQIDDC